jgi:hypothetical protein
LHVTFSDGSRYAIPVIEIARNRAAEYADEFDGDEERSLNEDTIPLFAEDPYEIKDWASNNMNWEDVEEFAVLIGKNPIDFEEEWGNAKKEVPKE